MSEQPINDNDRRITLIASGKVRHPIGQFVVRALVYACLAYWIHWSKHLRSIMPGSAVFCFSVMLPLILLAKMHEWFSPQNLFAQRENDGRVLISGRFKQRAINIFGKTRLLDIQLSPDRSALQFNFERESRVLSFDSRAFAPEKLALMHTLFSTMLSGDREAFEKVAANHGVAPRASKRGLITSLRETPNKTLALLDVLMPPMIAFSLAKLNS